MSLIPAAIFVTGVVDTGGKFAACVVDTCGNFPPASLTPLANLSPISTTLAKMVEKFATGVVDTGGKIVVRCYSRSTGMAGSFVALLTLVRQECPVAFPIASRHRRPTVV